MPRFVRNNGWIYILLAAFVLSALGAPTLAAQSNDLSTVKAELQTGKEQQKQLKQKLTAAKGDLDSTRKALVTLSRSLQDNEKALSALETRIGKLQTSQTALNTKIQSDYASISNLILALERIRRTPTETLILRPGAPIETAQSALLLRSILPVVNARAAAFAQELKQLQSLQAALLREDEDAKATAARLKTQKQDLQVLLSRREKLYAQTRSQYADQEAAVAKMAAEATSLEQLAERIEQQPPPNDEPSRRISFFKIPGGAWTIPVQGRVITRFGQKDEIGAASEGLRIAARPGALITAPVSGIVRYAGPFKNYGNMVIIEHDHDMHSLLAGLSRIDVRIGQRVSTGEPLGALPSSGAGGSPALYYELRHSGKPVDPSPKFPDLSS